MGVSVFGWVAHPHAEVLPLASMHAACRMRLRRSAERSRRALRCAFPWRGVYRAIEENVMQLQREYGNDADAVGHCCGAVHAAQAGAGQQQQQRQRSHSHHSSAAELQLPLGTRTQGDGALKGGGAAATGTRLDDVV